MILSAAALFLTLVPQPIFKVCIDPGHPSENGVGTHGKKVTELEAVWQLSLALRQRLHKDGVLVFLTKSSKNERVSNKDRATRANRSGANLVIRIHMDAGNGRGFATHYPAETGVVDGHKGPSDWVRRESAAAARAFHDAMAKELVGMLPDRGNKTDRQTYIGSKQGALTGSVYSAVPVILVESLVLTNPKDEAVYLDLQKRGRLVDALYRGTWAALRALDKRKTTRP